MSTRLRKVAALTGAAFFVVLARPGLAQTLITNVPVGSYPVAVAVNTQTNKIYVVNQSSNNVTVIDGATNLPATVGVGTSPTALAINPVTNKIYVTNGDGNSVTVIDGATNSTTTVSAGFYPVAIDVNPVTNQIYVANFDSANVTVIDGASNTIRTIGVGTTPWAVAVNALTNLIYVANYGTGTVSVINGATGTTATITVGSRPRAIAVNVLTNQIYVANFGSNTVSIIDGATDGVTPVDVGPGPVALAADAVHNRIYVANSNGDTATVIDGATLNTTTVTIGSWPNAVAADPIRAKAYFNNPNDPGGVTAVSGLDGSTVNVQTGPYPMAIALNPITNIVYTANQGNNSASVVAGAQSDPLQFMPIAPCRMVDTRQPPGPFGGPAIAAGTSRSFVLTQSDCGVPPTAFAYSLNVTVVPSGPLGFLTIWPTGETQPLVSTLNSPDGRVKANAAIVPAGAGSAVSVFTSDTTNVLLDINGYFQLANSATLEFYALAPCRVFDTRNQTGHLGGPYLHGAQERDFPVLASNCPVPASALAYSLNLTVVPWQGKPMGYLSTWAAGGNQPLVSTLNNPTATIVANAAIVPAGDGGAIAVYPSQDTDLVADIDGYFAAPGTGGLSLYSTSPCRVIDTRSNGGGFRGQRNPAINVEASGCVIPANAAAWAFNLTAIPTGPLNYLTLWPGGLPMPLASTLNAKDGAITSNMAILPNQNGLLDAYAAGMTQLILDISSYFAP